MFVITREDARDDVLARGAEERGFAVRRLGLLATEPGRDGERFRSWLASPPPGAAAAWTSRRAGEAIAALALPDHGGALSRMPLFAVGAQSAAPVRDVGLPVTTPSAGNEGARALGALIAGGPRPSRVAFLHGDRALPDLPEALRAAGIAVDPFELYGTRFLSPDVRDLDRAVSEGRLAAVAFFSPPGVESLERLLRPETVTRLRANATALARGATTEAALRGRGYRRSTSPGPSEAFDAFALDALQSLERTT
jgi:uroporphyrinogen-III synthase